MKTPWFVLGTINSCIFCSLAMAAAYPEIIWLDTYVPIAVEVPKFELEPELFRASAIKPQGCSLGGSLGCALQ